MLNLSKSYFVEKAIMKNYHNKKLLKKIIKFKKEKIITKNIINKKILEIKKLKHNLEKEKNINQKKIEFVSHLAHEFKTPLNAIIGFINLLEENPTLNEKQKKYCKNILCASKHLLHLSEYSIDMARLETNKLELNYSEFYPHQIIEEILSILEGEITQKHLFIKTKLSKTIIFADKRRFKQLVYNLIGNAIKYNKFGGTIFIKTFKTTKQFYFSIKDTGIGIEEKSQNEIFKFLTNIINPNFSNTDCHGIGLSLCKKIINLHNGEINFISKVNIGSKFWFFIPLQKISKTITKYV